VLEGGPAKHYTKIADETTGMNMSGPWDEGGYAGCRVKFR
jgi:hypothetical protein